MRQLISWHNLCAISAIMVHNVEYVLDRNEATPSVTLTVHRHKKNPEGLLPQGSKALAAGTRLAKLAYSFVPLL